jgi:hypothetical protein
MSRKISHITGLREKNNSVSRIFFQKFFPPGNGSKHVFPGFEGNGIPDLFGW